MATIGKLDQAIPLYQQVIKQNPSDTTSYYYLGEALRQQKHYDKAAIAYQQALRRTNYENNIEDNKPIHANAHNGLGQTLQAQGNLKAAIQEYQKALVLAPRYTEAKQNLNTALTQSKSDLERMLTGRAWIKEGTKEYPYRIIIQLGKGSELSIRSTEFENKDNPFFKFELEQRGGQQFIVPIKATVKGYVIPEIPYRLEKERDLLIIEGGQIIRWQEGSRKEIDLQGGYTPWFPTVPRLNQ